MKFRCFINGLFSLNNSPNIHDKRYGKAQPYPHDVPMIIFERKTIQFPQFTRMETTKSKNVVPRSVMVGWKLYSILMKAVNCNFTWKRSERLKEHAWSFQINRLASNTGYCSVDNLIKEKGRNNKFTDLNKQVGSSRKARLELCWKEKYAQCSVQKLE